MASGKIKDYQLTASSTYSYLQPYKARPGMRTKPLLPTVLHHAKYIDLAKPKSGARTFFPVRLKGTTPYPGQD